MTNITNRPGVRPINEENYNANYNPVGQQQLHSHFTVPFAIAGVLALFSFMFVYMIQYYVFHTLLPLVPLIAFGIVFVFMFLNRIDKADRLLWQREMATGEDIDGDGHVGIPFLPRTLRVNRGKKSSDIDLPPRAEGLVFEEWKDVAISLLNKQNRVSRRGLHSDVLSQAKATMAANALHKFKYAQDGNLNAAGFDWLYSYLPDHVQCLLQRPQEDDEYEDEE